MRQILRPAVRWAASTIHAKSCVANRNTSTAAGSEVQDDRCRCCAASEAVSAFYNSCPSTSPGQLPLFDETIGQQISVLQSAVCKTVLGGSDGFDCRKLAYDRPGINGGQFLRGDSLPANGTGTLTDTTGNTIASPVSGPTLVWRLGERYANVTAVAVSGTPGATTTAAGKNGAVPITGGAHLGPVMWVLAMFGLGMWML